VLNGVTTGSVERLFTQGSIQHSNNPTDLAIEGRGFFVLSDGAGNYYSRAGLFNLDKQNKLVNPTGLVVQGWALDSNGNTTGPLTDVTLNGANSPKATTQFSISANLDASAADGDTHSTVFTTYDSKGTKVTLTLNLKYDITGNKWDWTAASSNGTTTSSGSISFDANGDLIPPASNPTISITGLSNNAADMNLTWELVKSDGTSDMTSYGSSSTTTYINQDGYPAGDLKNISISDSGVVTGVFSNGQTKGLAQLALADFANPMGMLNVGNNLYAETLESGQPVVGPAKQGGKGSILAGSLEMANVDLASEFVDMITSQRAFQANSRIITASDAMLGEIVNLIR
jgi:flagellar hook protein FlgE